MQRLILAAFAAYAFSAAASQAQNRNIQIINDSSYTVYEFYASCPACDWGWDRLGASVLQPGWNVWVDTSDGTGACWLDLKAVGANGLTWQTSQDVCSTSYWRLTN